MICGCGHDENQHAHSIRFCQECRCPEFRTGTWDAVTMINGRWPLWLPAHRAYRPQWPVWEKERLASMHANLAPGDVIYDVGAEEGDLPALWATWGCDVVAIEPNPRVWPNIRHIWDANQLPPLAGWFVGFAADTTELHPSRNDVAAENVDGWPACAYGPLIGDHGFRVLAEQADSTPRITLDDLATQTKAKPDALTIDVEGAEYAVLRGAKRLLRDSRPLVWVSIHLDEEWMRTRYPGCDHDTIDRWMGDLGYKGDVLATDHERHVLYLPQDT